MDSIESDVSVCDECKHVFKRFSDLRKHVKKFHADKLEQLALLKVKSYEFHCTVCQKNFSARRNFKLHLKLHTASENESNNRQLTILENSKVAKSTINFSAKASNTCQVQKTLSERKKELMEKVMNEINKIESEKELISVEKFLAGLGPTVRAVRQEDAISLRQHLKPNGTPASNKKLSHKEDYLALKRSE